MCLVHTIELRQQTLLPALGSDVQRAAAFALEHVQLIGRIRVHEDNGAYCVLAALLLIICVSFQLKGVFRGKISFHFLRGMKMKNETDFA